MGKSFTQELFVEKVTSNHAEISVLGNYTTIQSKIEVYCHRKDQFGLDHGPYLVKAAYIRSCGRGCKKCHAENSAKVNTKYSYNQEYFSNVTATAAYWAGLIAADGCVHANGHVSLSLKESDEYHVQNFLNDIKYDGPLYRIPTVLNDKTYIRITANLSNATKIVRDLATIYNIHPRKSLTHQPPEKLTGIEKDCFIRGYIDGDGHVSWDSRYRIGCCGTKETLEWIKQRFDEIRPAASANGMVAQVRPQGNIWVYEVAGPRGKDLIEYFGSLPCPGLTRKWPSLQESGECREIPELGWAHDVEGQKDGLIRA